MKRDNAGFTLVEVLVAVMVLGVGITALAGSAAMVTRMVSRGQSATRAAEMAAARMDTLRLLAFAQTPHCTHPQFANGSATSGALTEKWVISGAGKSRTVTDSVTYKTGRGRSRTDVLITVIGCP